MMMGSSPRKSSSRSIKSMIIARKGQIEEIWKVVTLKDYEKLFNTDIVSTIFTNSSFRLDSKTKMYNEILKIKKEQTKTLDTCYRELSMLYESQ
jgi:hypothetical protein